MNKTAPILALLLMFSVISPSLSITIPDRVWHSFTGFGTIGGAILGAVTYKKLVGDKNSTSTDKQQKRSYAQVVKDILPWIGSTALGAAIGGIGMNRLLASHTQGAQDERRREAELRAQQAQLALERANEQTAQQNLRNVDNLILSANNENRLAAFINDGLDNRTIADRANTHFMRYPLVYATENMRQAEQKLINAQNLCHNTLERANGNQEIIGHCNNALVQIDQLMQAARDYMRQLQEHPEYPVQVATEGRERLEQQRIAAEQARVRAAEEQARAERERIRTEEERRRRNEEQKRRDEERRHRELLAAQHRQTTVVIQTPAAAPSVIYAQPNYVPAPAPTIVVQAPRPASYTAGHGKPLYNALDKQKPKPAPAPKEDKPAKPSNPSSGSSSSKTGSLSSLGRLDNPPLAGIQPRAQMNDLLNKMKNGKK